MTPKNENYLDVLREVLDEWESDAGAYKNKAARRYIAALNEAICQCERLEADLESANARIDQLHDENVALRRRIEANNRGGK